MIDKNKIEQAASSFAESMHSNANDTEAPFITTGDLYDECKESFICGIEFAEKEMKEIAIEFKTWCETGNEYLHDNIEQRSHSNSELFEIFIKEKDNERNKI